jgi:membrane-associated phospholipid phosphatase
MKALLASSLVLIAALPWSARGAEPAEGAQSVYLVRPWVDGSVILGANLISLVPYVAADRMIHPRCPCDPGEVNSFDRGAIGNRNVFMDNLSDATVGLAMGVPLLADGLALGMSQPLAEDATVFVEVLSVNSALVSIAKVWVQRPLPRTYAGDPSLVSSPGGYRSFYSGHTSTAFAALTATASTIERRYHPGPWPWIATAVIGTSVALERVAAGRHFPTDTMVGALAGSLLGWSIPWLHVRTNATDTVRLEPVADGARLAWTFGI